jgi:hypothetical protein
MIPNYRLLLWGKQRQKAKLLGIRAAHLISRYISAAPKRGALNRKFGPREARIGHDMPILISLVRFFALELSCLRQQSRHEISQLDFNFTASQLHSVAGMLHAYEQTHTSPKINVLHSTKIYLIKRY